MIYISTSCIQNKRIKDSVSQLADMGFRYIELSGGTEYSETCLSDLIELQEKYQLQYSVHNYFPPPREDFVLNIVSSHEELYKKSLRLIRDAIELATRIHANLYSLHPGYSVELNIQKRGAYFSYAHAEKHDKEKKENLFYERFNFIADNVIKDRIPVAIENLFPFNEQENYSLLSTPDEILKFLAYYKNKSNIGLLLDFGHLNVSSNYFRFDKYQFIERLFSEFGHKIFEIHLSENDGTVDNHQMISTKSWQIEWIRDNYQLTHGIPITFELHNLSENHQAIEDIKQMIRLMETH